MGAQALGSSFRDPSGFVYTRDGTLYRQVNRVFQDRIRGRSSTRGCTPSSSGQRLLVPHGRPRSSLAASPDAVAVLEPERVDFISYPYEWSFGQLRDAALLTLELQERALARGFTLRDASAYNVQFVGGRPLFIDTLSFEPREEGAPWAGYRQFCEHFLVPLALMSRVDVRAGSLLRVPPRRHSARSRQPAAAAAAPGCSPGSSSTSSSTPWRSGATPTAASARRAQRQRPTG